MKTWTLEVGDLFEEVGIKKTGTVLMNENTYDFDPKHPRYSWLYAVLLGFQELKRQGLAPKSFATIGTGSGIDSIGVYEIFHPQKIFQVDVHPNVPEIADKNAKSLIGKGAEIETLLGDLCQPLVERGIKVDLAYANIPNIPSDEPIWDKKVSASKFMLRNIEDCPKIFQAWCLSLQYLFLKQAKQIITPEGVVVDAIGARVPYEILEELFTANGYRVQELASVYKIQSEPEDVLPGYVEAEQAGGIEFDFYEHEKAWPLWQKELEKAKLHTPALKEKLKPSRMSATKAFRAFKRDGIIAGHICSILSGTR